MADTDRVERAPTEQALRLSEEHFRLLVEGVIDYAIFMLDPRGYIASWNLGAERIKGYQADEIIGKHFSKFYTDEDIAWDKPGYELKQATAIGRFEDEGWRVRKDGSRFWANVVITAIFNAKKELIGFAKITRDLTERKRTEIELQDSREQLRVLSTRLQAVREEERARLSREIHDELGGVLTALKMDVSQISRRVDPSDEVLTAKLASFSQLIDNTIKTVRKIATELRPGILDDFGLIAALEWQLADFEKRSNIKGHFYSTIDNIELDRDSTISVFRAFQETLTNVARHAEASEVTVNISNSNNQMMLEVHDNGRGIHLNDLIGTKSLGLLGMKERVRLLQGKLDILGKPGEGTTIRMVIPLKS
jgi:PAS domain S-box-containing protein